MSFAAEIKNELLEAGAESPCCVRAELCGLVLFAGAVLSGGHIRISTESAAAAHRAYSLIKEHAGISGEIVTNADRRGAYWVEIIEGDKGFRLLDSLGLLSKNGVLFRASEIISADACCRRAFLRGAFLGGGTAANPEKEYYMELSSPRAALIEDTAKIFESFGLSPHTFQRKTNCVLYFKNSEEIGDALNIMGAAKGYMEFTSVRILKERRNHVNRRINCDTANLDKTVDAAGAQSAAIRRLSESGKLASLPEALQEAARVRMENPEAPLSELAVLLKISKSGANHRMRKLVEMAKNL